jgi:DNA polymerase III delta subunit
MGEPSRVQVLGAWHLLWLQSLSLFAHAWRLYELTLPSLARNSFSSGVLFIDFSELNSGNALILIYHVDL